MCVCVSMNIDGVKEGRKWDSTATEATQIRLLGSCSKLSLVKLHDRQVQISVQISDSQCVT